MKAECSLVDPEGHRMDLQRRGIKLDVVEFDDETLSAIVELTGPERSVLRWFNDHRSTEVERTEVGEPAEVWLGSLDGAQLLAILKRLGLPHSVGWARFTTHQQEFTRGLHQVAVAACDVCKGLGFIISNRSDGRTEFQRCDACWGVADDVMAEQRGALFLYALMVELDNRKDVAITDMARAFMLDKEREHAQGSVQTSP